MDGMKRAESPRSSLPTNLAQFLDDSGEHRLRLMTPAPPRDVAVTIGLRVGSTTPSTMQPMQTRRPILAVVAALAVAAALVGGCSSSKQSAAPLPDAATLLSKSNLTTRNVKSVHIGAFGERQDQASACQDPDQAT